MYLVICNDKRDGEVIMQRKLSDAESWDETVRDLARGEWKDVSRVIRACDGKDVLPLMREWIDYKMPEEDLHEDDFGVIGLDRKRDLRKHEVA
jgi:hypothetical protein